MEVVHFVYNGTEIDFLQGGKNNVMVNATQMAKIFGKRVDHFLRSDHAKEFISVLEFTPFGGNSEPLKKEEIVKTRGQSGTWMHRILALKFAAWLNPKFELWVFSTIDQIILGHYIEHKEATSQKLILEREKQRRKQELIDKYPEFVEYLSLDGQISEAEKRRLKAIKESVSQIKFDLFPKIEN